MSASIKNVTCVGSGLIGQGWATLFAARGYEVTLQDVRDDRLENAVRQIHSNLTFLKNNGLVQEDAATCSLRIHTAADLARAVSNADYVQESVPDDYPAMLFAGHWFSILTAVAGGFAGIYALTVTTEGWMIGPAGWPLRLGMAAAAGMMFHLDKLTDLAGWVVFIALILLHRQGVSRAETTEVKT